MCYFERVVPKYRKKTHTRHEECKEIKKIPRQEKSLWVVFLFVFVSVYGCAEHSIIFLCIFLFYMPPEIKFISKFYGSKI